jgi:predicted permease
MLKEDIRHAFRRLRSSSSTSITAIAMLGVAIGITTAMFTLVDALVLRPVPFRDPERLAQIYMGTDRGGRTTVLPGVLDAWRATPAIEAAEAANPDVSVIETPSGAATRASARITPGLMHMLGVPPVRGRLFQDADGNTGDGILISEDLWRALFAGDPALVGKRIPVDGRPMTVVGILPADFRFPQWDTVLWKAVDFAALPAAVATDLPRPYVRFAADIPRVDALRQATQAAHAADPTTVALHAIADPSAGIRVDPYYERAVPLLAAGVILVFLVLCANVSSLLLARLTSRNREFSLCSALGASRGRLLGQASTESALMGLLGSGVGVTLAWLLVAVSKSFLPEAFLVRSLNPVNLDLRALGVASAFGVFATLIAGVLPAWIGTGLEAGTSLRAVERSGTEGRSARVLTRVLLVGEIALASTLLVGAALLVRSFVNLASEDRGMNPDRTVIAQISIPEATFSTREARTVMAATLAEEMRRLPNVEYAAWSYGTPPSGGAFSTGEWRSDVPDAPPVKLRVNQYWVGSDFFRMYGIPLLRGRTFQPEDAQSDVIVGERLAAAIWPGLDPLHRSFSYGQETMRVIGVAREIRFPTMEPARDNPEFYRPFREGRSYASLQIRCASGCPNEALIRQRLLATHAAIRVHNVRPLEDAYLEALARPRAAAALAFAFAAIAVIAAAGGLFSVLTYAVGRRRREFGIRAALGASPGDVQRLVLRDGATVAIVGLVIGSIAAWSFGRTLASVQYGVSVGDPGSWVAVVGLLGATVLAAAWRPARQAARLNVAKLLKDE